ncbi:MAG: response regulator [Bdellovibrionales bacterium]
MPKELKRILCIDDEEDILSVAKMSLELTGGYEVTCDADVLHALEILADTAPDLIVLDVMMPKMSGPVALAEIRKKKEATDIPVIFLTARVQPSEVSSYKAMGATGVIVKPFDPMTLAKQIKDIWEESHAK